MADAQRVQNSLSGDSRTLMLCNLSPNPGHFGGVRAPRVALYSRSAITAHGSAESLNSLRFAKTVSSATTNAAGRAAAPRTCGAK